MGELFTDLTTRMNEPEARWIAQLLEGEGIRCDVRPSFGGLHGVFGVAQLWPHTVRVSTEDYGRANTLLSESAAASVDIDWDAVDVGEFEGDMQREARPAASWARRRKIRLWLTVPLILILLPASLMNQILYRVDPIVGFLLVLALVCALAYPMLVRGARA